MSFDLLDTYFGLTPLVLYLFIKHSISKSIGLLGVFLKRENYVPAWEQKGAVWLKNVCNPRKGVYFWLPNDNGKGDWIAVWLQFSLYGSMSNNPKRPRLKSTLKH